MDLGIAGKRAAVAAGTAGLGLAIARALAAAEVEVAVCGRNPEGVANASAEGLVGIVADVSTADGSAGFVRDARDALGGIDIVVANAGGPPGGASDVFPDPQTYADAFSLNALSTIAMCQEAIPEMRTRQWGRVVAVTSIAARQAMPNLILSTTARAGVTGFLKTLAAQVAADGITVNSLQPGSHATDRLASLYGGDLTIPAAAVPTRTLGRPEDFGAIAAFLCSDQARFVTGSAILVDGGAYLGLQ